MTSSESSPDASGSTPPVAVKKRRLPGACDSCKRKKVKCDSGQMPGNRCTNCINAGIDCTHVELTKNLGSAKGYVENLEQRLEKLEQLLNKLVPGIDLNRDEEIDPDVDFDRIGDAITIPRNDDDDISTSLLTFKLKKVEIDPTKQKFFGKSSGFHLIQTALHHKNHYSGGNFTPRFATVKRPEYWELRPFQESFFALPADPVFLFPDQDLLLNLVDLYFRYTNIFFPILHQPTFEKSLADGQHLQDSTFGGTVLMVCAIGSRWSDDPRVYSEGTDIPFSAGWKFFSQVPPVKYTLYSKSTYTLSTLYELQTCALSCIYKQLAIPISPGGWVDIGLGLRIAQDVGAHRAHRAKRGDDPGPTGQGELWKRVFFVLLSLDRHVGAFKGRPTTMADEEFDLEYPLECDDEYWDHPDPSLNFKQPPDKPSALSCFVHYLKLMDILAYTMRTIYACKKPKSLSGRLWYPSEQEVIAELDSAMNQWLDSLPAHLRWDPNRESDIFFQQSVLLYTTYHEIQILIHKPFIPTPRVSSALSFPSLTICTSAARACIHIATLSNRRDRERGVLLPMCNIQLPVFTSAVVLLLSIWSGHRSGMGSSKTDLTNVQAALDILKSMEPRSSGSGRLWDILNELSSAGEYHIHHSHNEPNNKRPREEDVSPPLSSVSSSETVSEPRSFAGTKRVSRSVHQPRMEPVFAPPVYGNQQAKVPMREKGVNGVANHMAFDTGALAPSFISPVVDIQLTNHWSDFSYSDGIPHPLPAFGNVGSQPPVGGMASELPPGYDTFLWSAAPSGFDYDDWGTFINNFSQSWNTGTTNV